MPSSRTTVTELATGLGMLGHAGLDEALDDRPAEMVSVAPETWGQLQVLRDGGAHAAHFESAFANGAAFFAASEGLRRRRPVTIEWKGSQRAPGDEVAPIDLRVDHVYLISCKYDSKILLNTSPSHLFDELLAGRHGRRSGGLVRGDGARRVRGPLLPGPRRRGTPAGLPNWAEDLRTEDRKRIGTALKKDWPEAGADAYASLARAVSTSTAARVVLGPLAERRAGGHAVAPPPHGQRPLLRAGCHGEVPAPSSGGHPLGLATTVPAGLLRRGSPGAGAAPDRMASRGSETCTRPGRSRSTATSRSAGATAASEGSLRPRSTWTPRTTRVPGYVPLA